MKGETLFIILFFVIILGYAFVYTTGRRYLILEKFQAGVAGAAAGSGSPTAAELYPSVMPAMPPAAAGNDTAKVVMETVTTDAFTREAINSLADYDYNLVYQTENDRALSTDLRNKLMSQRPMDWAGLPPSSARFQAGMKESFQNASQHVPDEAKPYKDVNGDGMTPPDSLSVEMEERKLLQAYKPPTAQELESYNLDLESAKDPEDLIRKLYDKKGLIPTVAHKEGTNVYEVVGVRKKDEKIVYEGEEQEAPAAVGPVQAAGEANIVVPPTAVDVAAARDPFYDARAPGAGSGSRMGKWDYQAWTPGLERMFAPTEPRQNWY